MRTIGADHLQVFRDDCFRWGQHWRSNSAPPFSLGAFTSPSFAVDLQFMKEITLECNSRWTIRIRKEFKICQTRFGLLLGMEMGYREYSLFST